MSGRLSSERSCWGSLHRWRRRGPQRELERPPDGRAGGAAATDTGQGQAIFHLSTTGSRSTTGSSRRTSTTSSRRTSTSARRASTGLSSCFLYGPVPPGGGRQTGVLATGTITAADLVGPLTGQPLSALVDAMRAGHAYVNVHTNDGVAPTNTGPGDFPGGRSARRSSRSSRRAGATGRTSPPRTIIRRGRLVRDRRDARPRCRGRPAARRARRRAGATGVLVSIARRARDRRRRPVSSSRAGSGCPERSLGAVIGAVSAVDRRPRRAAPRRDAGRHGVPHRDAPRSRRAARADPARRVRARRGRARGRRAPRTARARAPRRAPLARECR